MQIFMYNEFTGETFPCDPMANGTYYCAYPNQSDHPSYLTGTPSQPRMPDRDPADLSTPGEQILQDYEYENVKMWQWYLVIVAMILFFRVCFYLVLRFLNRGKR